MRVYLAELFEIGQQDPVDEALAKLAKLDERVPLARAELSALAAWWPTSKGSDLAEQLQTAIYEVRNFDQTLIEDHQIKKNASDAVNRAVEAAVEARDDPDVRKRAFEAWEKADTLANQLRAEIRGDAAPRAKAPAPSVSQVVDGSSANRIAPALAFSLKGCGLPVKGKLATLVRAGPLTVGRRAVAGPRWSGRVAGQPGRGTPPPATPSLTRPGGATKAPRGLGRA